MTVTNNVIVTSACWGIFFSSVHSGKIINNTVVDDGTSLHAQPEGTASRSWPSATRPIKARHPTT